MRKRVTRQGLVALFTLLGAFSPAAAQPVKVAIGYSGISADQLVIWVARDTGIFAKNNLDAQAIYFSGGTLSVTAMISGDTPLTKPPDRESSAPAWRARSRSMSSEGLLRSTTS
jgi:ABC-type nitrate/sulfonate/bicarbonate transport system substrate-binding protein